MPAEHVNIHGKAWDPSEASTTFKKKPKSVAPATFHKGWMVEGIPPGALEAAQAAHEKESARARAAGKASTDFDRENWLMNARLKRVRSKPYETAAGAAVCRELAERTGWLRVSVIESKKGEPTGSADQGFLQ